MKSAPKKTQIVALFDISSSSVGGAHAIISTGSNEKIAILSQSRYDAPLQEDLNIERFVNGATKNLESVIDQLKKADIHHPHYIQITLASPWYVSQTRAIVYKKETPFVCNQKLIDTLIQKEIEYVLEHDMGRFGSYGKDGIIVEKQLSLVKLNGYNTSNPLGMKAQMLELFMTITVAPKIIVEKFTDILHKSYRTRKIGITTSPYTTFVVGRDHFSAPTECMIIDVGEEVTDVAFVKDSLFLYQHSFPVGTYELYRLVSGKNGSTPLEAKALIEAYRLDKISAAGKKVIQKALTVFQKTWQTGLQKILDEGHYGFCLPDYCFVTADPRFELIFMDVIKTDPFIQHTCSKGVVHPTFMTSEVLDQYAKTIDNTPLDTAIVTTALFVQRLM